MKYEYQLVAATQDEIDVEIADGWEVAPGAQTINGQILMRREDP